MRQLNIGCGAGFAGDRIDPAVALAERGDISYLVFECLAERTIALAQQAMLDDPEGGFDPLLEARFQAVLPACRARGIRIITNMGAANPLAAARRVAGLARGTGLRVAAVLGDDVLAAIRDGAYPMDGDGTPVAAMGNRIVSANAYTGAAGIVAALAGGADVVITGRAADPAMFLAPLVHEFGWAMDDWTRLGRGTLVGHLLECAGQVTGGYFADPGFKDVHGLARLGFPIAEVTEDGNAVITKLPGSGGLVTRATCTEQLLYEVHDPARYLQPDVVADFSGVRLSDAGHDRVAVMGGAGHPRTGTLKVTIGLREGWIGEGQISYAGPGALARGRLAQAILAERLADLPVIELRSDLIGVNAMLGQALSSPGAEPAEVRLRLAGRCETRADAQRLGHEVEALYLNGPAGGGGVTRAIREVLGVRSILVPEAMAQARFQMEIA